MKDYKKILEGVVNIINTTEKSDIGFSDICAFIGENCPELAESEDEKIRKAIITFFESEDDNTTYALVPKKDILAWLEKQGDVNALIQEAAEKSYTEGMRVERKRWLEKQGEQNLASSAKISKNEDTFLDILNKMPSYITVDGIDYHFVMKKTSIYIAYYACYKGNGEEGRGNAIFGITAHSPIDLLTEMLEILKEKGLLE